MSDSQKLFGHIDVEVLATKTLHSGFLKLEEIELRHQLYAGGWSTLMRRELLSKAQAVGVLLFDPCRDQVVLVRQFRIGALSYANSPWLLELVAGMVGPDEDAEQVAIREAMEESNCIPDHLLRICDYLNSPGTSNEKLTLYCGRVDAGSAGGIHGLAAEHEDIAVVVLDMATVVQAIATGEINNAMTIIAIQWLQLHKPAVLQAWQ